MSSRASGVGPAFIKPRSKFRKWLPLLLLLGSVGCLVGAFFQFRLSQTVRQATVILVMDASQSMAQPISEVDVQTRLDAAQNAAHTFLDNLPPSFRVGLVTFADAPSVPAHPTLDRGNVTTEIDSLTAAVGSPGTVIGDGLNDALDSLQADREKFGDGPAAMLLLTDGLDKGSQVAPSVAAEEAAALEVPVFTVLLGEPTPDANGVLNSEVLAKIAEETGASTFNAETAGQLTQIYGRLGSTLSTELAVTDIGLPFLIAAGALGLLAGVVLVTGTDTTDWR